MELTFDLFDRHSLARDSGRGDATGTTRPDWHALAARLAAAHAFQRHGARSGLMTGLRAGVASQTNPQNGTSPGQGSFHQGTAGVLAGFEPRDTDADHGEPSMPLHGPGAPARAPVGGKTPHAMGEAKELDAVNPTSSGDRKDASGTVSTVAGLFPSGNRGLK